MSTLGTEYAQEVSELLSRLRGTAEGWLDAVEGLHRVGVWSSGNIRPRGTLYRSAENRLPNPGAIQDLLNCLEDHRPDVRRKAALALGQWGGEEVVEKLAKPLRGDPDSVTALYCISGLRTIGGPLAVSVLSDALRASSAEVQSAALSAILDLASGGSVDDTESAVHLNVQELPARALPPEISDKLQLTLSELREGTAVPFSLRFKAGEALTYLSRIGVLATIECPGLWSLVRYLAEGEKFEDIQAMRQHLEDDRCSRCTRRVDTGWVRVLVHLLRSGRKSAQEIRSLIESSALLISAPSRLEFTSAIPLVTRGVENEPQMARSEGFAAFTAPASSFLGATISHDEQLAVRLQRTEDDRVLVTVTSKRRGDAGRSFNLELLLEGSKQSASVVLKETASGTAMAQYDFGPWSSWGSALSRGFELIAWPKDLET